VSFNFGKVLKQYRMERGFTQWKLGKEAGLSPSYILRLERAERFPSYETVERLALALRLGREEKRRFFRSAGYLAPEDLEEEVLS